MFSFSQSLTLFALASLSAAQQFNLTPQCTASLTNIFSNPDVNQCLRPGALLGLLANGNSSVIGPINNWLNSLCPAPQCSNATIAGIVSNFTSGCPVEAAALGVNQDNSGAVAAAVQRFYPTVRRVVCLKDGNTNCVTQTLTNIEAVTGTLTITRVGALLAGGWTSVTLPPNVTCTNCIKASYNILNQVDSDYFPNTTLTETCGASFVDGKTPEGIVESASGSNNSGNSQQGGSSSGSLGLTFNGASVLTAFFATFGGFILLA